MLCLITKPNGDLRSIDIQGLNLDLTFLADHTAEHRKKVMLFNACSFVAGGPEPKEGGGLAQAQTFMV